MSRHLFMLLFSLCCLCGAFGCGGAPAAEEAQSLPTQTAAPEQAEPIELYLPADYAPEMTAEEVAATVERLDLLDGVLHEDGSVTYTLQDETRREALLKETETYVFEKIKSSMEEQNLTVFTEVVTEPPFSEINVMIDAAQYRGDESELFHLFYDAGGYYQAMAGVPADEIDVVVNYIDGQTNEVLASGSSRTTREREAAREASAIDVEDVVVVDNENMRMVITKIYPDDLDGYGIGAEIENRTQDTWRLEILHVAANGLMVASDSSCEVLGGKQLTHSFTIPKDLLAACGIADVTDLVISFKLSNSSAMPTMETDSEDTEMSFFGGVDMVALFNWLINSNFCYGPVHICPYGEERVSLYAREPQEDDRVLYASDVARVTMFGGAFDADGGYSAQFYLENLNPLAEAPSQRRTDLVYSVFNPKINGTVLPNSIFTLNVEQRSAAYLTATWTKEELSAAGIQEIRTLEVLLNIQDTETGEAYAQETIKILP